MISSSPQRTTTGSAPIILETTAACSVSSSLGVGTLMVNVGIDVPRILAAIATTMLEWIPAGKIRHDRHVGTSAIDRRQQHLVELIDQLVDVRFRILLALVGEVDDPVGCGSTSPSRRAGPFGS